MAPSRRGKKGPVQAAEFPKDTYAILPKELSDLNEVRLTSITVVMEGHGLRYAADCMLARGFYILSKALYYLRRLGFN